MATAHVVRADYAHLETIPPRWADNDVYGHVDNVGYDAFFDTVINRWLRAGAEPAIASGWFVHVFVDRASRRPADIPPPFARRARAPRAGSRAAMRVRGTLLREMGAPAPCSRTRPPQVSGLAAGYHVVLTFVPSCGSAWRVAKPSARR